MRKSIFLPALLFVIYSCTEPVKTPDSIHVSSVSLNTTAIGMPKNDTLQLTATVLPNNATNKNVTWESSNNSIATVSSTGLVTSITIGDAIITVTTEDGLKTATCNIYVEAIAVSGVALNKSSSIIQIGGTTQLVATITPSNAENLNVSWDTDDESIATVSSTGLVAAIASGDATITVTTADNNYQAICSIAVREFTSITVTPADYSEPHICSRQFYATGNLSGGGTENITDSVVWSSSNDTIVEISPSGLATSNSQGSVNIIATFFTVNGQTTFTVTEPVIDHVTIYRNTPGDIFVSIDVNVGQQIQLHSIATYTDTTTEDVTNQGTWDSTNGHFSCVNGLVTGLSTGFDVLEHMGEMIIVNVN